LCRQHRFQTRYAGLKLAIFDTGFLGHRADGFEFFTLDNIEVAQHALTLAADHAVYFALDALGSTGGVCHELGKFIKQTIGGLGHHRSRCKILVEH
jgi:hypothetical protein